MKRILSIALGVVLVTLLAVCAFAAEEMSKADGAVLTLEATDVLLGLLDAWDGKYVIFVNKNTDIKMLKDLNGKNIYCDMYNFGMETSVSDMAAFMRAAGVQMEIGLGNNVPQFYQLMAEDRNRVAFIPKTEAESNAFQEDPNLMTVVFTAQGTRETPKTGAISALPMTEPIDFDLGSIILIGVNEKALILPASMKEGERAVMVMMTLDIKSDDAKPAFDKLQEAAYLMDADGNQYHPGGAIRVKKDSEADPLHHILLVALPKEAVTWDMVFGFEDQRRTLTPPEQ